MVTDSFEDESKRKICLSFESLENTLPNGLESSPIEAVAQDEKTARIKNPNKATVIFQYFRIEILHIL